MPVGIGVRLGERERGRIAAVVRVMVKTPK
jgi:hypothetical protein